MKALQRQAFFQFSFFLTFFFLFSRWLKYFYLKYWEERRAFYLDERWEVCVYCKEGCVPFLLIRWRAELCFILDDLYMSSVWRGISEA